MSPLRAALMLTMFLGTARAEEYFLVLRGVAPAEDREVSDRVTGRVHYGVASKERVGYVVAGPGLDDLSEKEWFDILADLRFYANSGAAMEAYRERFGQITSDIQLASELFPEAKGRLQFFLVPAGTELSYHPESNATVGRRVVGIPAEAELVESRRIFDDPDGWEAQELRDDLCSRVARGIKSLRSQ